MRQGNRLILNAHLLHAAGLLLVAVWLAYMSQMPFWMYASCVYGSFSILKIRTFLEHRAHDIARCRSVIIEGRGLLPFLFMNNKLHAVHHARLSLPWYRLPAFYRDHRAHFLRRNHGYLYRSYRDLFSRYMLKAKDPVAHALWPFPGRDSDARASPIDLTEVAKRQDSTCSPQSPSDLMGMKTTARRLPNEHRSGRARSAGDR